MIKKAIDWIKAKDVDSSLGANIVISSFRIFFTGLLLILIIALILIKLI